MNLHEAFILILVFATSWIVAYLFMDKIEETAQEFKEQQVTTGSETLGDLYCTMSPEAFTFMRLSLTGVLFLIGAFSINIYLGALMALGGYFLPGFLLNRMKEKRVRKIELQLVEGLELMGNALKSGLTLNQAIELLVREFPPPISQEFNLVLAENRLGVDITEALHNMSKRLNSIIVSILVTGVAITKRCGGDLNEIFQNIATTIREQSTIEGKLNAVTAQGRFQGMILSVMPFALMAVLYFIDRAHIETLFGYTIGLWAVGGVLVMVILAQLWIKKMLTIDV